MAGKIFWQSAPFIFVVFWSGGYTFAKLGLTYIEPMTMLAIRYGLAAVILAPLAIWLSDRWPASLRHWSMLALTGFLVQCVYFGFTYLAFKKGINAGTAAVIMSLQPILVAAVMPTRSEPKSKIFLWFGLVLGLSGVLLATSAGNVLGPSPLTAIILTTIALSGITIATLFEKSHGIETAPIVSGFVQYLVGFIVLLPVAFFTETMEIEWKPELAISLGYLVLANSIISVGIYFVLLQRDDATKLSSLFYLVPPLAMLIAWAVLDEEVTQLSMLGFVLSAAGVYIVSKNSSKKENLTN